MEKINILHKKEALNLDKKSLLVISAHAADFVWRCGGTIAKYVEAGHDVHVIVLSYGVRGESNDLWKKPGQTTENVKRIRDEESRKAAAILGVEDRIEYWDFEDYPLTFDRERLDRLVGVIRKTRPDFIITHDKHDVLNPDHDRVSQAVFQASIISNSRGALYDSLPNTTQMQLFGFEPHQTELSGYVPGILVDITDSYEKKVAAMQCFKAQSHLIEYYTQRAFQRGNHARRLSGCNDYRYAETFSRFFPLVSRELL